MYELADDDESDGVPSCDIGILCSTNVKNRPGRFVICSSRSLPGSGISRCQARIDNLYTFALRLLASVLVLVLGSGLVE